MIVASFADFVVAVGKYLNECPKDWRTGQAAFNLLVRVRPELAEMVRGSDFDPFYRDDRLTDFYCWLIVNWDE